MSALPARLPSDPATLMQHCTHLRVLVSLSVGVGACAAPDADPESHAFDPSVPRWSLSVEAEVGGADEAEGMILGGVMGGVLLDDGGFALGEGQTLEVRFYDGRGAFRGARGGRGQGPGEFTFINWVDSPDGVGVTAWDPQANRVTSFPGLQGDPSTRSLDLGAAGPRGSGAPVGLLADGTVVVLHGARENDLTGAVEGEHRDTARVIAVGADDSRILLARPGTERFVASDGEQSGAPLVVFGSEPRATVMGPTVVAGGTDTAELTRLDPTGAPLDPARIAVPALAANPDAESAVRQAGVAADSAVWARIAPYNPTLDFATLLEYSRDLWTSLPARDTLPRFSELRGDRAGHLWVRAYVLPTADSVTWARMDAGFDAEGRVVVPAGWRILDQEGDRLLVALRDAADRWIVRMLRAEGAS